MSMTIQPLRVRSLPALAVLGGGLVALAAAAEVRREIAALSVLAAALLDLLLSPRLEAAARFSRFDRVLLDICRQVPYGLAPTFAIYLGFRAGADAGGPGFGVAPAAILAALPCALGCVRFTRDDVLSPRLDGVRFGPHQAPIAIALMAVLNSHLFAGPPFVDPRAPWAPPLFGGVALLLVWLSLLNLSLSPGPARSKAARIAFAGLLVLAAACAAGSGELAAGADIVAAGLSLALPLRGLGLLPEAKRAARDELARFYRLWREQQGPRAS